MKTPIFSWSLFLIMDLPLPTLFLFLFSAPILLIGKKKCVKSQFLWMSESSINPSREDEETRPSHADPLSNFDFLLGFTIFYYYYSLHFFFYLFFSFQFIQENKRWALLRVEVLIHHKILILSVFFFLTFLILHSFT